MKQGVPVVLEQLANRRVKKVGLRRMFGPLLIDAVTGLPNHFALELFCGHCRRRGWSLALVEVDIRGFGKFNERRGGMTRGNELLATFAAQLCRAVKSSDLVARWSIGDEFIVAARHIATPSDLQRLCERLEGPFEVNWGRRRRLLRCYAAAAFVNDLPLTEVERRLHERLRRVKAAVKAAERN